MRNRCKQIVERLAIVFGIIMAVCFILYAILMVFLGVFVSVPHVIWLGGETKGRYIVERINSAANPCESESYIHLWKYETPYEGAIWRYDLENGTAEELVTADDQAKDFFAEAQMLYFQNEEGDYKLNLRTKELRQLSQTAAEYAYVLEKLEPAVSEEICRSIEDALGECGYSYVYADACRIDRSDDPWIGITQEPVNRYSEDFRISQHDMKFDILYSYDPKTQTGDILYQTKNNRTRIIGYEDGVMYLNQRNHIYKKPLEGEKERLVTLPPSDSYTFDWWDGKLIVLDHETNKLVEVVEV